MKTKELFDRTIEHLFLHEHSPILDSLAQLRDGAILKISVPRMSATLEKRGPTLKLATAAELQPHLGLTFNKAADFCNLANVQDSKEFGNALAALRREGRVSIVMLRTFPEILESGIGRFYIENDLLASPSEYQDRISNLALKDIAFTKILDVEYLHELVEDLARMTGVRLWVLDMNVHPVAMSITGGAHCRSILGSYEGWVRCYASAAESLAELEYTMAPRVRRCHAGFVCFDAPLILDGEMVGMITGDASIPDNPDQNVYKALAAELNIDAAELLHSLSEVRHLNIEEIEFILSAVNAIGKIVTETSLKQYLLKERVQELNTLNRISTLLSTHLSGDLRHVYSKVAETIASHEEGITCELDLSLGDRDHHYTAGPATHSGNGSRLSVDINVGKTKKGSIGLDRCAGLEKSITLPDRRFLESIGSQISMALQNSSLYVELKNKNKELKKLFALTTDIQEKERARIARDLHDDTGQNLTNALLNLGTASTDKRISAKHRKQLESAEESIGVVMQQLHDLSVELHPPVLDNLGLVEAANNILRRMNGEHAIRFGLELNGDEPSLSYEIKINLYRIIQEALSNTIKHSGAKNVLVCLSFHDDGIDLLVSDDGSGCEEVVRGEKVNLGLVNMRERSEQMGGHFKLLTSCSGTTVAVHVPGEVNLAPETGEKKEAT